MTKDVAIHEPAAVPIVYRRALNLLATGLGVFLVVRMFVLINHYSVNVLSWDNWNYYFVFSRPHTLWQLFDWRLGPHRMGVGLVVSSLVSRVTHWNMRAESFLIGGWIVAATIAALALKHRLFGKFAWHDAVIPLLLLTPMQWEIWANTPNASHGAIPLLLVMLYCLAWTIHYRAAQYALVLAINFLAVFTGFALFIGAITVGLFACRCIAQMRRHGAKQAWPDVAALLVACATAALFLYDYKLESYSPTFRFPDPHPWLYPVAMAVAMARVGGFIGVGPWQIAAGIGLLLFTLVALIPRLPAVVQENQRQNDRDLVIVILIGFSLLFMADMAIGRISLGLDEIQSSRYVPLEMPALIGLYFAALAAGYRWRNVAIAAMIAIALYGGLILRHADHHLMKVIVERKIIWVNTYLATNNIILANQTSGTIVHPDPGDIHLRGKLAYLKANKLSFFYTGRAQ